MNVARSTGVRPESSGGARVTAVLEPGVKVLQIMSLGTKARGCSWVLV